jgi:cytochrome P450
MDDLASALLGIHDEDLKALTQEEVASILFSLSFEEPARWQQLVEYPDLIAGAVDEILRRDPSNSVWRRVTKAPVTPGGVDLPAGAKSFFG